MSPAPRPDAASAEPVAVDATAAATALADLGFVDDAGGLLLPTSATTGAGRTVRRSLGSWTSSMAAFSAVTGIGRGTRVVVPHPAASSLFAFGFAHARAVGATVITPPRWNPAEAADLDVDAIHLTPAMLSGMLDRRPPSVPPPALRTAVVAGAALPSALRSRARDHGIEPVDYYGAAELSFVAVRGPGDALVPFPGVDVEIRDGEIWVRSPYLSDGYLPGRTGPLRRDGAWATVGDRGELTADGALVVRGRGDAVVITGGTAVPVEPVEALLGTVAGVAGVAVVGTPHLTLGQVVTAVVVGRADESALRRVAREQLPEAHRPRRWLRTAVLPMTAAGKLDRTALAAWAAATAGVGTR